MNAGAIIERLDRFAAVLPAVVSGLSVDEARWRPTSGARSILEIVHHLADEEAMDFRPRLERTLGDPSRAWDPIDPEGWARDRRYNEGDAEEATARFVGERQRSIVWLWSMASPDWSRTHEHPRLGPIRAGDLLAAWSAHDFLHLRQISKRLFELTAHDAGEYATDYAGQWGS